MFERRLFKRSWLERCLFEPTLVRIDISYCPTLVRTQVKGDDSWNLNKILKKPSICKRAVLMAGWLPSLKIMGAKMEGSNFKSGLGLRGPRKCSGMKGRRGS